MKLFGGLLPFIGFCEEPVDEGMRRFFNFGPEINHSNTFQMEWWGCGIVICTSPVDPDE